MFAYFKVLAVKLLLCFVPSAITALEWILKLSTTSATAESVSTTATPSSTPPPTSSSPSSLLSSGVSLSSSPVRDSPGSLRERKLSRQTSLGTNGAGNACVNNNFGSCSSSPTNSPQSNQRKYSQSNSNLARRTCRGNYSLQVLDKLKSTAVISDINEPFENLFTIPNDLFSFTNLIKTLLLEITFLARLYRWALSVRERCHKMFRWKPTSPEDLDLAEKKIFSCIYISLCYYEI